jgi:integrase
VADQVRLLAHVSRWLAGQNLDVGDLTSDRVEAFLAARRSEGYVLWLSTKGVAPLLTHLRGLGAAPMAAAVPRSPIGDLLAEYRRYLLEERGIAPASAVSYTNVARLFLAEHSDDSGVHLEMLSAAEVVRFVSEQCRLRNPAYIVCGLRSFLRFSHLYELTAGSLAGAIPAVASWRLATLPKVLTADHVRSLLASCDRRTTFGQRDFAVLTMLVRLGLRAGEVAASELSDIDWHAGEIVIRGKGPRIDRLPLPTDVGEAVASWLQHGRGECACPNVFTRVRAPRLGLTSSGVSAVVSAGCRRAGRTCLPSPSRRGCTGTSGASPVSRLPARRGTSPRRIGASHHRA